MRRASGTPGGVEAVFLISALVVCFFARSAAAELPEAIVAQAPDQPRGEWFPNPGLFLSSDGNFYGTTRGQNNVNGTVFKLSGDGTTYTSIHPFTSNEAIYAGVVEGPDGDLYGTINAGQGSIAKGAVFKVSKTGVFTTLHSFAGPDGANPSGPVVVDADGTIYGTTFYGGADAGNGFGTVFELDPSGTFTTLYDFGVDDGAVGGANPRSNLLLAADGTLYGTTATGGQYNGGTVFELDTDGQLSAAWFGDTSGSGPHDILFACDKIYGRAFGGAGIIFELDVSSGTVTTLHGLTGTEGKFDLNPGDGPAYGGGLMLGESGKFYGVAEYGNTNATLYTGTAFELALDGTFTVLYTFKATITDGQQPLGIAQGTDGNLYGAEVGHNNGGGVFKLTVPSGFNDSTQCPGGGGGGAIDAGTGGTGAVDAGQGDGSGSGGSGGSVSGVAGAAGGGKMPGSSGCSCTVVAGAGYDPVFLLVGLAAIGLTLRRGRRYGSAGRKR